MIPSHRLALANLWVAISAFTIASAMALMQALSRADLDLPFRTPKMYYLSVTAHGVLMAIVFTTFFIMALGYFFTERAFHRSVEQRTVGWISFGVATLGTLLAAGAILLGKASVLYTFYPPLKAHPLFYIGATLLIVGSWGWSWVIIRTYLVWKRENPESRTPLAVHGMLATIIVWLLATVGVAAEALLLLIPWSLGFTEKIDPILHPQGRGREAIQRSAGTARLRHVHRAVDSGRVSSSVDGPRHRRGLEAVPRVQHAAHHLPELDHGVHDHRVVRSGRPTEGRQGLVRLARKAAVG
jgi:hypothetical protein